MEDAALSARQPRSNEASDACGKGLFARLPAAVFLDEAGTIERNIKFYIDLSRKAQLQQANEGYFVSKYVKRRKEVQSSQEIVQRLQKEFSLAEYATNFRPEVYSPKAFAKEPGEYYESLVNASIQRQNLAGEGDGQARKGYKARQ